jgi:[methyl-Co(III) methanol-specific corrinoid protein]:coenzyme M methyltransferase
MEWLIQGEGMSSKELIIDILQGDGREEVPFMSPLQTGTLDLMKLTGSYWPDAHHDSSAMARLAAGAHTFAGMDNVRVPFDMLVGASAFGAEIGMGTVDRQLALIGSPIAGAKDLESIDVPDPHSVRRSLVVLEAVEKLSRRCEDVMVVAGMVCPFTLTTQLNGYHQALMNLYREPDLIRDIIEPAAEWCVSYSSACIEAGADAVAFIDGMASNEIIGPPQYAEFALPSQRKVFDSVRGAGALSILHICGRVFENIDLMVESGADGVSIDQEMEVSWVKEKVQGKTALLGNVSPFGALLRRGPEEVRMEALKCIDDGVDILSPGCGFAPHTPLENMRALVSSVTCRSP